MRASTPASQAVRPYVRLAGVARRTLRLRGLLRVAEPVLPAGGRAVGHATEVFVGIDGSKMRNEIAVADGERGGEVRYLGEVDASPDSMRRLVARLGGQHELLHFCFKARPTGYGLHSLITELGHSCSIVAPYLIPREPSDRVKSNGRDAVALAKLLRAGELPAVWLPDASHEAMHDLVRARAAAV